MVTPADSPEPQPQPETGAEQVRRAARVGRVLARTGTGLLVLGLAGAVTVLGTLEPPTVSSAAPLATVAVPAAGTTLVCPGTVRVPTEPEEGEDVAYDPQFDPSPGESVARLGALVVDGAGGSLAGLDGAGSSRLEGTGPVVVQQRDEADQGLVLRGEPADPEEGVPAWDAGAVTATTTEGDLRGLAAAPCQRPATDVWLVGGSTALGSSARLVLQNPGQTAATVQLDLWGPAGQAEVAGSPEYLVPPGSERVVLLEGVAAEQRRVVVHLTASGGLVTAYLQDSEVRGLVPAGVDHVSAGQAPALRQVVPGIAVTDSELDGTDTAQLRLLAPGESGTSARVTFLGPDGVTELPGTDQVDLDAGEVLDLPLGGLPAGTYTAVVQADEPVVAGALVTRGESAGQTAVDPEDPLDRAWVASAVVGHPAGSLSLPEGPAPTVSLAVVPGAVVDVEAEGRAAVVLELVGADGTVLGAQELSLAEATTTTLSAEELAEEVDGEIAGLVLRTEDPRVVWGAVLTVDEESGELVSVLVPVAPEPARPEVGVRLR